MEPSILYKYLPSQYVDAVLKRGELLFRNLSYFRQYECEQRGDPLEGHHKDNPDNDIVITNLSMGSKIKGDFSFLNLTDTDHIYVFCLSKTYSENFFQEFESDACIEINDVPEFIRRSRIAVKRLVSAHRSGLLHKSVTYYLSNEPIELNIKDPKELIFAKDLSFKHQDEYRLAFGKKNAFKLEQKIVVNSKYDFRAEATKGTPKEKMIRIGNITDIVKVKYFKA